MTSLIGKAVKIKGQLESSENIQIDGEIEGDVRGLAVKVGSGSTINGTVYGDEVELAGTVRGSIAARKVVLTRTAHMSGDVIHQNIQVDSGAFVDGHCRPEFGTSDTKSPSRVQPAATSMPEKDPTKKPNGGGA
jgi:cytoskeletal protein CcmA (bactofilin family)